MVLMSEDLIHHHHSTYLVTDAFRAIVLVVRIHQQNILWFQVCVGQTTVVQNCERKQ